MELRIGRFQMRLGSPRIVSKVSVGRLLGDITGTYGETGTGPEWANAKYGDYYAISVPAYRAIKLRADAVASAPFKIFQRRTKNIPVAIDENHPIQRLLDHVNPWWTAADLWKATETYLSLWGSAFWFLGKEGLIITSIWPLRPDKMRIMPDRRSGTSQYIAGYEYETAKGGRIPLVPEEVVWFRYFNPLNELAGLSPVAVGRLSLDMGRDALRFNRKFFQNGAMPQDVIFTVQGPVTEEEVNDFYKRLEKRFSGPQNAYRPMLWDLSQGAKPEKLGLSQRDMEFIEGLNYTIEDAARVWGIPPPKMYSQKQSIYNNVKQADQEFYTDTISTEWRFLETEVNELLLPLMGDKTLFGVFDTSNILPLQEILAEQYARDRQDVLQGILTINEARERRNLPPLPWGNAWWIPFTQTPAGSGIPGQTATLALRAWDSKNLDKVASLFAQETEVASRRFLAVQKSLFNAQKVSVISKLHSSKAVIKDDSSLLNIEEWNLKFKKAGRPVMFGVLSLAAEQQGRDFGLGDFDPGKLAVQEWIDKRVEFWADRVNVETAQLLMAEMNEGIQLRESIKELQARIEKVFNFSDVVRSERIARTETVAAANAGHLAIYEQSGVVEQKEWVAALDERTREAHAEAHGQVVALQDKFSVGGELLEAPGIGGSPGNVINCRCTIVPVIAEEAKRLSIR